MVFGALLYIAHAALLQNVDFAMNEVSGILVMHILSPRLEECYVSSFRVSLP